MDLDYTQCHSVELVQQIPATVLLGLSQSLDAELEIK
jgi:hypothetical protein